MNNNNNDKNMKNLWGLLGANSHDASKASSTAELIKLYPMSFYDSKVIGNELKKGNVVLVNFEESPNADTLRTIDFITGILYIQGGTFKKVGKKIYLLSPSKELLEKFSNNF